MSVANIHKNSEQEITQHTTIQPNHTSESYKQKSKYQSKNHTNNDCYKYPSLQDIHFNNDHWQKVKFISVIIVTGQFIYQRLSSLIKVSSSRT